MGPGELRPAYNGAMKIWRPKDRVIRNGIYGGVGTRRSDPIWTPRQRRRMAAADKEPRRRDAPWRQRRTLKVPDGFTSVGILLVAVAVLLLFVKVLFFR